MGATKISKTKYVWEKKNQQNPNERDINLMTIMSLVRESKIEGTNKSEVWKTLLKHRWDIESPYLSQSQVAEVI